MTFSWPIKMSLAEDCCGVCTRFPNRGSPKNICPAEYWTWCFSVSAIVVRLRGWKRGPESHWRHCRRHKPTPSQHHAMESRVPSTLTSGLVYPCTFMYHRMFYILYTSVLHGFQMQGKDSLLSTFVSENCLANFVTRICQTWHGSRSHAGKTSTVGCALFFLVKRNAFMLMLSIYLQDTFSRQKYCHVH